MINYQQWGNIESSQQILLIHGWGMNSGVWSDVAEYLQKLYPEQLIRSVDLPGYGYSSTSGLDESGAEFTSETYNSVTLAQSVEPLLEDKQSTIIAWSMGGLVAIDILARRKSKISKLVLVSSTPMFVQSEHWPHGVEARIFEAFSESLINDHQATLRRFLAIQAMGSRTARNDIKTLQRQLLVRGEADVKALELGLKILLNEDKRQQLKQIIDIPICLIAGKQDMLAKYAGQKALSLQANISLHVVSSAGHAPFISHPGEFKKILDKIL